MRRGAQEIFDDIFGGVHGEQAGSRPLPFPHIFVETRTENTL